MSRPRRLAIFTTHPIQYQAPWFRALSNEPDLTVKVFFSYSPSAEEQGVGFGHAFTWDIVLREGYSSEVLRAAWSPGVMPRFLRRPVRGLSAALELFAPDAALILGWQEVSLVQALWTCRRRAVPVILRGESNALRPRGAMTSLAHRTYFGWCQAFLAIGRANAALYRAEGAPENRIAFARYFVDNERFRSAADIARRKRIDLRARWNIPQSATCFGFFGKLEAKKCLIDFLHATEIAYARDKSVHALIVGSGEQNATARAFARDRSLPVSFAGFLNQSEMATAYAAADVLVLPSDFSETWGLVVNEGMAAGLPAIVSDRVGCAHDLVIDGATGHVFPHGSCAALADVMAALARDQGLCERLGSAAQARVCRHYSIEKAVQGARQAMLIVERRALP